MFRELRRIDKKMDEEKIVEILTNGDYGVLSVIGDNGYPYGVPLNYYYEDGFIYFHCAETGHKIDAISNNAKVSFVIIDSCEIIPEELNTHFASVSIFGKASIIGEKNILAPLKKLGMKYSSQHESILEKGIEKNLKNTSMIMIEIEHMMGKSAK